jgi:hypothetical protein
MSWRWRASLGPKPYMGILKRALGTAANDLPVFWTIKSLISTSKLYEIFINWILEVYISLSITKPIFIPT